MTSSLLCTAVYTDVFYVSFGKRDFKSEYHESERRHAMLWYRRYYWNT